MNINIIKMKRREFLKKTAIGGAAISMRFHPAQVVDCLFLAVVGWLIM